MLSKSQIRFLSYFGVVFITTFILLYSLGLVPESLKVNQGDSLRTLWDKAQTKAISKQLDKTVAGEQPIRIVIDKIGVDATVSNPNTTNVATLDDYLKEGAVRYPGSGFLGSGNMFVFAHSTGIKVVNNQAYKTFNGLKNLENGDIIKVFGASGVYTYRVKSVTLVDKDMALVEFDNNRNMLTLSTCNTFGATGERYVVEADYVSD